MKRLQIRSIACLVLFLLVGFLPACSAPELPQIPEMPSLPDISQWPGIPESLRDLPGLLNELGLPDLSQIADLPQLEDLPLLQTPPGAIVYNGPTERRLNPGDRIPGTDIVLTAVTEAGPEFQIGGMHSVRALGDSLDFDGDWPTSGGISYNVRMRIYYIGSNYVRAAGVHRMVIQEIHPVVEAVNLGGATMKFPFTTGVNLGETIAGTTLGYAGQGDRGGQISGLPEGEFPFRKIGDSIHWAGRIRSDIPAEYNIRMLYYDANSARVGGIVTVAIPGQ